MVCQLQLISEYNVAKCEEELFGTTSWVRHREYDILVGTIG